MPVRSGKQISQFRRNGLLESTLMRMTYSDWRTLCRNSPEVSSSRPSWLGDSGRVRSWKWNIVLVMKKYGMVTFWQPEKPIIYGRFSLNVTGPKNSLHRTVEEFENLPAKKLSCFWRPRKENFFADSPENCFRSLRLFTGCLEFRIWFSKSGTRGSFVPRK